MHAHAYACPCAFTSQLSVVDARPQELLVLTLDGLVLEQHEGRSAGLAFSHSRARVRSMQVRAQSHMCAWCRMWSLHVTQVVIARHTNGHCTSNKWSLHVKQVPWH